MNNRKRPWYIWFSFLGLALLWGDTIRRTSLLDGQFGLWARACWNIVKIFITHLILPIISLGVFSMILERFFPWTVAEDPTDFMKEIGLSFVFLLIYLCGVHATYKHAVWRRKNLPYHFEENEAAKKDEINSSEGGEWSTVCKKE